MREFSILVFPYAKLRRCSSISCGVVLRFRACSRSSCSLFVMGYPRGELHSSTRNPEEIENDDSGISVATVILPTGIIARRKMRNVGHATLYGRSSTVARTFVTISGQRRGIPRFDSTKGGAPGNRLICALWERNKLLCFTGEKARQEVGTRFSRFEVPICCKFVNRFCLI